MTTAITIISIIVGFVWILSRVASRCFDDNDPDMYWYDNYTVIKCPHLETTDVTVDSTVTCETIHTICDACGKVLEQRTEC